jgi:hypothetical protein
MHVIRATTPLPTTLHVVVQVGDFLVRESKSQAGQLVLSVRLHDQPGPHSCCALCNTIASIIIEKTEKGYHFHGQKEYVVMETVPALADWCVSRLIGLSVGLFNYFSDARGWHQIAPTHVCTSLNDNELMS